MGVGPDAVAAELLPGGELYAAIDAEGMAIAAYDHVGVAAAIEVLADGALDFVGDSRSQSLTNVDMLAGHLDLHGY
jgi:hypothetical protein